MRAKCSMPRMHRRLAKTFEHVKRPMTSRSCLACCPSVLCIWEKNKPEKAYAKVLTTLCKTNHSCDETYPQKSSCQMIAALYSKAAVTNTRCVWDIPAHAHCAAAGRF